MTITRKDTKDEKSIEYFDKLNDERKDKSMKRVAEAIRILEHWTRMTSGDKDALCKDAAHVTNLLESVTEELKFHCEWYDYDTGVILLIDDACSDFGSAMAALICSDDDFDFELTCASVKDGVIKLSKALATLVRWDDDPAE